MVKNPPANVGHSGSSLGQEDPLEEAMETHSSILAWEIPGMGAWWAIVHSIAKESDMI